MKQILQHMKDGKTVIEEVPVPGIRPKMLLVQTAASLLSAGTERMVVEFAGKNLVGKALSRPDLVRQVVSKAQREGVLTTIEAAFNKLDQPMALGYSSAGVVIEVGAGVTGFKPGDRVACAGGGFAVHAEYALVPQNLAVHLPDSVDFESAAFTTLGAIAMQGFRLAAPQVGESVCVIGMGLLGLLTAQIARAAGCSVLGADVSEERVQLAESLGFRAALNESIPDLYPGMTGGKGFDHVIICADTPSNEPVELAGLIARDRATVVATGAVGLQIPRKIYYEKELSLKISRSYGPGRYDPQYEEGGVDYPLGYVRWTEGRNLQSFVDLLASGKVDVKPLITHRFAIAEGVRAYDMLTGKTHEPFLGVLLLYPHKETPNSSSQHVTLAHAQRAVTEKVRLGVLGAGNYAQAVFLPIIKKTGRAELTGIATASGLTAKSAASKFGFNYASSSEDELLHDAQINTVVILTRHQHHARQVVTALQQGKSVYCEKPLALDLAQLEEIEQQLQLSGCPSLTVGYNRRFAPLAVKLAQFFQDRTEPIMINYRVNAGFLPLTHWLHDPAQGGGRIIGEGCHFIDFLTFLVGSNPVSVSALALPDNGKYRQDNLQISFRYADGSLGTVTYLSNGNKNFAKERVEAFSSGKIGILDDFRSLELVTEASKHSTRSALRQDKGHAAAWDTFLECIQKGDAPPIPYDQLSGTSRASFAVLESLRSGKETTL